MKINSPTLLVDRKKCEQNIEAMAKKATSNNCIFRPHFKTHNSAAIAKLYRDAGVSKITVSSVKMANYFASQGWNDITIAFPLNILEMDDINQLASKIKLGLLIETIEAAEFICKHLKEPVQVYLKIDTGYHRTGIWHEKNDLINTIIQFFPQCSNINFSGFITHAGHSYQATSLNEIKKIHTDTKNKLLQLKERYLCRFPDLIISVGDTPTCSIVDDFSGIDEIRPGNFVYYDAMQMQLGVCQQSQIAAVVACPVVALHRDREELVIHGGAVHLSKEALSTNGSGTNYGWVIKQTPHGWSEIDQELYVKKLSQEHGIVNVPAHLMHEFKVGDLIYIIPVHSCLTANLLGEPHFID